MSTTGTDLGSRQNHKVLLLTGAPASGKSTLADAWTARDPGIRCIPFGHLLFDHLRQRFPQLTYEQLRSSSASVATLDDLQATDRQAAHLVASLRTRHTVILESHSVTIEAFGFRATPFLPETLRALAPDAIVFLSCTPSETVARCAAHPRGRHQPTLDEARHHALLQETVAVTNSTVLGCPYFHLRTDTPVETVVEQAAKILDSIRAHV